MAKKQIKHQLLDDSFFIPSWSVKYLFLGTFNPSGGDEVSYFYGRSRNQTWKLLSEILKTDLNPNSKDFFEKIKELGIACMDMIQEIEADETEIEFVIGKGYSDPKIINGKVKRVYNTENILKVITQNPNAKVFSTWGKGSILKEWRGEVAKIEQVKDITKLVSPSLVAKVPKGVEKFNFMKNDWTQKI